MVFVWIVRLFFTGPVIKTELMVVWLEKHGIASDMRVPEGAETADPEDLSRDMEVWVPVKDYDRAWQLFYADREDEL